MVAPHRFRIDGPLVEFRKLSEFGKEDNCTEKLQEYLCSDSTRTCRYPSYSADEKDNVSGIREETGQDPRDSCGLAQLIEFPWHWRYVEVLRADASTSAAAYWNSHVRWPQSRCPHSLRA